jgi:hypothetical protein
MKTFMTIIAALGIVQAYSQTVVSATVPTEIASVSPHSFSLARGSILAGGIWDMFYSDNFAMVLGPGYGGGMTAQLMLEGRLPVNPSALSISVESHATSPHIQQTVAMWDWDARTWVVLGSEILNAWDARLEYAVPDDFLRFSEAGTGRMQAAIGFRAIGSTYSPLWQARMDSSFWTYSR